MEKNRKKGFSMIELVITVATLAILVSMIGPVIRYYMQLTGRYNRGVLERVEVEGAFTKIEELIGSITLEDKNKPAKNTGTGVRTEYGSLNGKTLSFLQNQVTNAGGSEAANKTMGNTLYILIPVFNENTSQLVESYHVFRFKNDSDGKTNLYYTNNLDANGYPAISNKTNQDLAVFRTEEKYLPSGTGIKELVTNGASTSENNYFIQVEGGVIMHLEYYKDPGREDKNSADNIVVTEKLFLKRGEI